MYEVKILHVGTQHFCVNLKLLANGPRGSKHVAD